MPVRDIARIAVRLLTMGNNSNEHYDKAYIITGPEALSYQDAAELSAAPVTPPSASDFGRESSCMKYITPGSRSHILNGSAGYWKAHGQSQARLEPNTGYVITDTSRICSYSAPR